MLAARDRNLVNDELIFITALHRELRMGNTSLSQHGSGVLTRSALEIARLGLVDEK